MIYLDRPSITIRYVTDDVFLKQKSILPFQVKLSIQDVYSQGGFVQCRYFANKGVLQIRDADFLVQKHRNF